MVAQVTISQTYTNSTDFMLEARYKFSLPENAAVNTFNVDFGNDRKIIGKVEEKQVAEQKYQNALAVRQPLLLCCRHGFYSFKDRSSTHACEISSNQCVQAGDGAYLLEEKFPDSKFKILTLPNDMMKSYLHPSHPSHPSQLIQFYFQVFEMKVGNLAPSKTLTVNIRYVQELASDTLTNDLVRFSLPTTIAPRYVPRGTSLDVQESVSVVYSEIASSEYVLALDVTCTMTGRVLDMESTTHDITTQLDTDEEGGGKVATATLKSGYTYLNKDFVLLIKAENLDNPRAFSEYNEETDTHCVMLTMVPRFALTEVQSELVFVVDRSGSMSGAKIARTGERSLPEDCFFNVISFGSSYQPLFPNGSAAYSSDTLQQALKLAQRLDASLGGTEIHEPLEWAFKKARSDVSTTVLLLTDGEVSNVDSVIELTNRYVRELKGSNGKGLRVFTLGVGDVVSHHLVDSVARAGRGYSQYVGSTERLERKVVQMLKNSLQPPIADYKVTWTEKRAVVEEKDGWKEERNADDVKKPEAKKKISFFNPDVKIEQNDIPSTLPSYMAPTIRQTLHYIPVILPHTYLIIYCFLAPGRRPAKAILLEAQSDDGPIELEVGLEQAAPGSLIHTLAARRMIAEMEEGTSYLHHDELGTPLHHVANHIIQREIVAMGVQFSLATQHTSFIAATRMRSVGSKSSPSISL
ncbi:von Willebrand factor type A domain-containing protein [Endogone sp. FLAS-F59071]|nr:von Willebrand factor type A domain-containing protein [Endogone sp. FLAS-F59071]|eukprot:RUS15812.1 von Willebrand factor type A domain-containing protein [Endogone sp. FLAS-F59071]